MSKSGARFFCFLINEIFVFFFVWENNEWELDLLSSSVIDKVGKENADCDIELE